MSAWRIAGIFFWTLSGFFFVAGIATVFWEPVDGLVTVHESSYMAGGYQTRWASRGGPVHIQGVSYRYMYDEKVYEGGQACFCIPISALNSSAASYTAKVYVFPAYPVASVLKQGPDLLLVIVLAAVGAVLWHFSSMTESFFSRAYKNRRRHLR